MRLKLIFLLLSTELCHTQALLANGGQNDESPFRAAIPVLGILTFLSLLATFTLGLLFHHKRMRVFQWHRRMAFTTLTLAVIHGTMVLLFHE
jgi:hypothetical protein